MMRILILLILTCVIISCKNNQADTEKSKPVLSDLDKVNADTFTVHTNKLNNQINEVENEDYNYKEVLESEFIDFELYKLLDTIKEDLNGDDVTDKVVLKKANENSGIIIIHGQNGEIVKIGFGNQFAHLTNFDWVDYWGIMKDTSTFEIIVKDTELINDTTIQIFNPSIILRNEDLGGGLITFRNGRYEWIHQSD